MPKMKYKDKALRQQTLDLLILIDQITTEYLNKGFTLTVRQLFYQMVARGYIENTQANYKRIGNCLKDGRLLGLIDWDAIEDRTRYNRENVHWQNPQHILKGAAAQYMIDRRETQPCYVEAWIEKDALIGVLEQTARKLDIPCFSCRGYPSISVLRDAAIRFTKQTHRERRVILYAGDHDPSGLDIPREIKESLVLFGADVEVKRIGLTMEQINLYNPPPNTAKETDTRAGAYIEKYGFQSWELDALEPQVLAALYEKEIEALTEPDLLQDLIDQEGKERQQLYAVYQNWNDVLQYVET